MNVSDTNENEELIKENTLLLKKNSIQGFLFNYKLNFIIIIYYLFN